MRNALFIGLPIVALAAWGVSQGVWSETGQRSSRAFPVGSFTAVSLDGSDNVRVIRGPTTTVSATGPQKVLDALNIRVERNTLKIDRKSGWSYSGPSQAAIITVTMPMISAAAVDGSGDLTIEGADGASFSAAVEGSGDLTITKLAVRRVQLAADGSGDLTISGTADEAAMAADSSGDIHARELISQRAAIAVDGSGTVKATVRDRATISVAGSGDVDVTGTDICTISKEGSGMARCTR
jgi:hypothetical protein